MLCSLKDIKKLLVAGNFDKKKIMKFILNMQKFGSSLWDQHLSITTTLEVKDTFMKFSDTIIGNYDPIYDEFIDLDWDNLNILKLPRIGKGKHNIHFDPEFSSEHMLLEKMATEMHITEILEIYLGKKCSLRETGLTLTRPLFIFTKEQINDIDDIDLVKTVDSNENNLEVAGEGMEWHSDGPRGEVTVLVSFNQVTDQMGSLRVLPSSHKLYIDGVGHDEVC